MKFGSWTYDGLKLDIDFYDDKAEIDISDYIESNEWNLIAHPVHRDDTLCNHVWSRLIAHLIYLHTLHMSGNHRVHEWNLIAHPAQRHVQYYVGLDINLI